MHMLSGDSGDTPSNLAEAEQIFITVRRQGWIILDANVTTAYLSNPDIILQLTLEKCGDGFLYNALVSEDMLSQINLLMPPMRP